jgi:uncharacterized protein YlbG (UPF0298 family)
MLGALKVGLIDGFGDLVLLSEGFIVFLYISDYVVEKLLELDSVWQFYFVFTVELSLFEQLRRVFEKLFHLKLITIRRQLF